MSPAAGKEAAAHVPSSVTSAAEWLAFVGYTNAVVPQLRSKFGLSAKEAVDAIRAAQQIRGAAR
jgi:hypothetical protein